MGDPAGADTLAFLLDGLARDPSPVLLLACAEQAAAQVAVAVRLGTATWAEAPPEPGRLLSLAVEKVAAQDDARLAGLFTELAPHWLYVPGVDGLTRSAAGTRFLGALLRAVAQHDLPALIASVDPARLTDLHRDAPRLVAFATTVDSTTRQRTGTTTMVVRAGPDDRADTGWAVLVRFDLSGPVDTDGGGAVVERALDASLDLVDSIQLVDLPGRPPPGVLVSLRPDAFTLSQEAAALATATLVARRVVGRALLPGETVTPARSVYYA